MHNYRRQDRTDKFPDNVCTTTAVFGFTKNDKYLDARCIEQLPSTLEDPVDVKFHVVTPNIYGHEPLLPSTSRLHLLPLHRIELEPLR